MISCDIDSPDKVLNITRAHSTCLIITWGYTTEHTGQDTTWCSSNSLHSNALLWFQLRQHIDICETGKPDEQLPIPAIGK